MGLESYVIEERGDPDWVFDRLLVLLHGYSSTERDLTPVGPLLDPNGHYLICGLRGPFEVDAGTGYCWFPYDERGPHPLSLLESRDQIAATIAELCDEREMRMQDVVIGGFSQGAAMSLAVALGEPAPGLPPPAGVISMCGFLAESDGLDYDWTHASEVPVLLQNGTRDPIVDIELGRGSASALESAGVPTTYLEYPMAHQVTVESLAHARDWLADVRAGHRPRAQVPDA
jgi:phospholipase/carboxylesterase